MEKISIVGIGKLGLCFGLTLEKAGYDVLGCDINNEYVNLLNSKTFYSTEDGVNMHLKNSNNFRATTILAETIEHSDTIFVVVSTPSLPNGRYNHSQVDKLTDSLISLGVPENRKDLIICCTTMPQYCDTVQNRLSDYNYDVSYNPEFIAQGTILRDQASPDMILIGEANTMSGDKLEQIYKNHTIGEPKICRMLRTEAEICKISLNCFLTTKIAFANMVGDIAEYSSCNPDVILQAIGSDTRIGLKYLGYGYGYGGPCFPRDNRALALYASDVGIDAMISNASDNSNKAHLIYQVGQFCKKNDKDKLVTFDYVTYKPQSTMIEESQQLLFAVEIAKRGYKVCINERPSVISEIQEIYGDFFTYRVRDED